MGHGGKRGGILLLAPWFVRRRAGVCRRCGGPCWAGRLAGCGVLAGALLIFLAFHRRQVVDLLVGLRVLKPKPETPEPENPQTED